MRSRFQAMELEMEMLKNKIPYVVRGGKRFFEQAHIKDVLAFMKITQNPLDEIAFKRAVCLKDGVGQKGAQKIFKLIVKDQLSTEELLKKVSTRQKAGIKGFNFTLSAMNNRPLLQRCLKLPLKNITTIAILRLITLKNACLILTN